MVRKRHRPSRKRKELKPFRFDSLPGEIRLEVYNHCFVFPILNTNVHDGDMNKEDKILFRSRREPSKCCEKSGADQGDLEPGKHEKSYHSGV
ncbi:hypothetical protein J7T55_014847 [Diaporthe amygdali]|uniref:uncharacterized protein n=1 Tax=Phomopsis amygdali TaxID=1214568 RepID=UPI0022FDD62B|nr:uncharacterized protein J7T55_014847 [Diaporthe amygdali]KAJ0110044.1 hypothetical protein J7T55_014847 [Diaporthe amygdali]